MEPMLSDDFYADRVITETLLGSQEEAFVNSGVLVCDSCGRVILCGEEAARIFSGKAVDLEQTRIGDLLLDVSNNEMPPGHSRRSLAYLSAQTGKHRFNAISLNGWVFPVIASVREILVDQIPLYLVRLFHAADVEARPNPWGARSKQTESNIGH
jgi:hypothetical protein